MNNVQLDLVGGDTITTKSGAAGVFSFTNVESEQQYSLTPSKQGDLSSSTILSFDASLAARISIDMLPSPTDFQIIAADVDLNDSVQMYDASLIVRHAVDLPALPGTHTGDWTFDPQSRSYPYLNSNITNADFTAIVYGDVDGNWTSSGSPKRGLKENVQNFTAELKVQNGALATFPIFSEAGEEIYSCDVRLEYDSNILKFIEIKKTGISEHFYVMINDLETGKLRFGCYGTLPIVETGKYLELVFEVIDENASFSELNIESYRINAEPERSGVITIIMGNDQSQKPTRFFLYQNYPNPFNPTTVIKYQLAKDNLVKLQIYDVLGRLLKTLVESDQKIGNYEITWDGTDNNGNLLTSGLYLCKLKAGEFQAVTKLLFLK